MEAAQQQLAGLWDGWDRPQDHPTCDPIPTRRRLQTCGRVIHVGVGLIKSFNRWVRPHAPPCRGLGGAGIPSHHTHTHAHTHALSLASTAAADHRSSASGCCRSHSIRSAAHESKTIGSIDPPPIQFAPQPMCPAAATIYFVGIDSSEENLVWASNNSTHAAPLRGATRPCHVRRFVALAPFCLLTPHASRRLRLAAGPKRSPKEESEALESAAAIDSASDSFCAGIGWVD